MLEQFVNWVASLGPWAYVVIFVIILLECQVLLGLFMPGETMVLVGGFMAEQGVLDLRLVIGLIALAAIIGDSIGFEFGRYLGIDWLVDRGHRVGLRPEHVEKVDRFFSAHGGKAVFASHFLHLLRAMMPFIAGSRRMPYRRFLIYNSIGCVVWATSFVLVGYFVGASWRIVARRIGEAGQIVFGVIVFAIVFRFFWKWLVRREADLHRGWQTALDHPIVAGARRRVAPSVRFLLARLSPEGFLGLHLTAGIFVLAGASWLFSGIAEDVMEGSRLTEFDRIISNWFHARQTPSGIAFMEFVSFLASAPWVAGVGLVVIVSLVHKKCWHRLTAFVLAVGGGMALEPFWKITFHRQRPSFTEALLSFDGFSFPSGHTMAATLLYGMLAILAVISWQTWRWRFLAVFGTIVMISLVGLSRVYLGAHYPSDVLAAAAGGLAWTALCTTVVDTTRRGRLYRAARRDAERDLARGNLPAGG